MLAKLVVGLVYVKFDEHSKDISAFQRVGNPVDCNDVIQDLSTFHKTQLLWTYQPREEWL